MNSWKLAVVFLSVFVAVAMFGDRAWGIDTTTNAQVLAEKIVPLQFREDAQGNGVDTTPPGAVYDCSDGYLLGSGTFSPLDALEVGFDSGVILTTGKAADAIGPNTSDETTVYQFADSNSLGRYGSGKTGALRSGPAGHPVRRSRFRHVGPPRHLG